MGERMVDGTGARGAHIPANFATSGAAHPIMAYLTVFPMQRKGLTGLALKFARVTSCATPA